MRRRAALVAGLALAAGTGRAAISAVEAARIERLLHYVESQQQAKFIRNGIAYSGKDAATFLRAKYDKMGAHVATAAQFIDQIASRSSTSGQDYLIRFPDGRTMTAAKFLGDELARIDRLP